MKGAQLKEALAVFVHPADAKAADAAGPGVVVCAHSGVEVSEQEQVLLGGDLLDLGLQLLIEFILSLCCGVECGGVGAKDVNWSRGGGEAEGEDSWCARGGRLDGGEEGVADGESNTVESVLMWLLSLPKERVVLLLQAATAGESRLSVVELQCRC